MRRVCAWCKSDLGTKDAGPGGDNAVTHGICAACLRGVNSQMGVKLQEYLDTLEAPVLAVDPDVVVKIANEKACRLANKRQSDMLDRKGGEVFECAYARLPGGCGRTVHCSGCAIRMTVAETHATGIPRVRVPAYLCQGAPGDENKIIMYLSTEKVGDLVLLRIERAGK